MNKAFNKLIKGLLIVPLGFISSCDNKVDMNNIVFEDKNIIQQSFGGLGVEWGAYEDVDKISQENWIKIFENMDRLNVSRIRLMISYDWICYNFDNKNTEDKNDDTWTYNFTNKWAQNTIDILSYCQEHDIEVAFGAWNVIANLNNDVWGMLDEVSSDIRWAKITRDVLDYLVNKKGFTCIKWFVNTNEPNYTGVVGSSKNALNTYEKWEQGVKNVRRLLDEANLHNIGIVGGDVTVTLNSNLWRDYLINISKNIKDQVADYGAHMYLTNMMVDRGQMMDMIKQLVDEIKINDDKCNVTRMANIWESGLVDGKNSETDCQNFIRTYHYGVRMADYTLQALIGGINGITYWDFDDAMHFMYNSDIPTPKEWGMFSSLSDVDANKQELRPWYHSSTLLTNLFKKGNIIVNSLTNDTSLDKTFRCLATYNEDLSLGGYAMVNQGTKKVNKSFRINKNILGDKLYIYQFGDGTYKLDEKGYIAPNYVIDGKLSDQLNLEINPCELIVVANQKL